MKLHLEATADLPDAKATPLQVRPAVGDSFNPHVIHRNNEARRNCGLPAIYLPAIVSAQREVDGRRITDGPKRVYDYLVGRSGQNGVCWPSQETISKDLGKSERQIRSDLRVLEDAGLITHKNRAGRRSNTYSFIWHEIFERQWTATQVSGKVRSIRRFEQDPVILSGSGLPTNIYSEFNKSGQAPDSECAEKTELSPRTLQECPRNLQNVQSIAEQQSSDAPPSTQIQTSKDVSCPRQSAEQIAEVLTRHKVQIRSREQLETMLALAEQHGAGPQEFVSFIEAKCLEKAAKQDRIRSANFFIRYMPDDLPRFLHSKNLNQTEISPPRFWVDPYENYPIGKTK